MNISLLLFQVPSNMSELDYYTGLVGSFVAGLFCFYLAYLIRDSKREERTDRALAMAMFVFGAIAWYGTFRFATLETVPYMTPALWVLLIVACAVATIQLQRERRQRQKVLNDASNR